MSTAETSRIEWRGDEMKDSILDKTRRAMDRVMADCVVVAKELVPVDTTALQRSIQMRPTVPEGKGLVGYWGSFGIRYAIYQEMGTGMYAPGGGSAYEIRPKHKKALFWEGAAHPVASVMHPGVRARPYLRPAADAIYPELAEYIRQELAG